MKNAKLKPLYLYDIFKEKTDAQHPMSVPELTQELLSRGVNAERKGVYRDIDALIQYGADIAHGPRGYYLRTREFDAAELHLLFSAVRAASFISPKREAELTKKLAALAGEHKAEELMESAPLWCEKARDDTLFWLMDILGACIAAARQVTFLYGESGRDTRRYRVNPYLLMRLSEEMLLVGNVEGEEGLREFSLAYMSGARVEAQPRAYIGDVSEYKTGLTAEAYVKRRGG
ncbi:MAG: hypothetical protein LLF87_03915 [Eubacteriales bacterium]|nr:hypothetical protein [Eubacteriales bacterium]